MSALTIVMFSNITCEQHHMTTIYQVVGSGQQPHAAVSNSKAYLLYGLSHGL